MTESYTNVSGCEGSVVVDLSRSPITLAADDFTDLIKDWDGVCADLALDSDLPTNLEHLFTPLPPSICDSKTPVEPAEPILPISIAMTPTFAKSCSSASQPSTSLAMHSSAASCVSYSVRPIVPSSAAIHSQPKPATAVRDKRQERLIKNRESANRSRQRRKAHLQQLETETKTLRASLASKEQELMQAKAENSALLQQVEFLQQMVTKLSGTSSAQDSAALVKQRAMPSSPECDNTTDSDDANSSVAPLSDCSDNSAQVRIRKRRRLASVTGGIALLAVALLGVVTMQPPGDASSLFAINGMNSMRKMLTNEPVQPKLDDSPPLWMSPTSGLTFALYAMGMHHVALSVLTWGLGGLLCVGLLYSARL